MGKRFNDYCIVDKEEHDNQGKKIIKNFMTYPNNFKILYAFGERRCLCHE